MFYFQWTPESAFALSWRPWLRAFLETVTWTNQRCWIGPNHRYKVTKNSNDWKRDGYDFESESTWANHGFENEPKPCNGKLLAAGMRPQWNRGGAGSLPARRPRVKADDKQTRGAGWHSGRKRLFASSTKQTWDKNQRACAIDGGGKDDSKDVSVQFWKGGKDVRVQFEIRRSHALIKLDR